MENRNLRISLLLHFTLQQLTFRQNEYHLNAAVNNSFFIDPYFTLRYSFNPKNYLNTSYIYENTFGTVNDVYRGAILNSFKELSANSSDYLLQVRQHRLDFGYTFNDPLALHGFSVFARNQHNQFTNDTFIPFTNDIHSTGITAGCNLIDRISFLTPARPTGLQGNPKLKTGYRQLLV